MELFYKLRYFIHEYRPILLLKIKSHPMSHKATVYIRSQLCLDKYYSHQDEVHWGHNTLVHLANLYQVFWQLFILHKISISWVNQMRYLGVFLVKSRVFKCDLDHAKRSFYRAANAIFGRIGIELRLKKLLFSWLKQMYPCSSIRPRSLPTNQMWS